MALENNFLSPLNFKLVIHNIPNVEYTVQSIVTPGIQLNTIQIPTPFVSINKPSTLMNGDLHLRFKVGEDLTNYLEILNWMIKLSHPDNLDQFDDLKSDCTVIFMDSSRRPNMELKITDAWPQILGPLSFDTTMQDVQYMTADVAFKFLRFYYQSV